MGKLNSFCLILTCMCFLQAIVGQGHEAPALYAFGDSLLDSGNNNYLPTWAKANYYPYGSSSFPFPTGRFSNGKNVADFVAEFLGLPLPPPAMSRESEGTVTGLNYASGSCGILPATGLLLGKCLNLDDQIYKFQCLVEGELTHHFGSKRNLLNYLSKSIVIFNIGSNDIGSYPLFLQSRYSTPQQFAQILLDALSKALKILYGLGVRKVVVFEIGPLGCTPGVARTIPHLGPCSEITNQLISIYNTQLDAMLKDLTSTLHGSNFVIARYFSLGLDIINNPSKYGLTDTRNPCCTALFGTSSCIPMVPGCKDAAERFFWDGVHQTEAVYKIESDQCIHNSSFCSPLSIEELVRL
ncbi:GDSL lipase/esterase [Dillenia turbinata]|uniref:GDSL lipase/esterase n=1 Tax=Dillenia turbinata TaxID=194707 RepID=A0AAN8ULJ7_9MAGN